MISVFLMYHDVYGESPEESGFCSKGANFYKLPFEDFDRQILLIKSMNDKSDVVLTFDDGGKSSYTLIAPILEKHNIRGNFFIATDYIGQPKFMTKEQIKDLSDRGHIIGSHSCSHSSNMNLLTQEERKQEWSQSCAFLSEIIGRNIETISIPNGYVNYEDVSILKGIGIKTVYTSYLKDDFIIDDVHFVGRFGIMKDTTTEKLSSIINKTRFYRKEVARQYLLRITKKILGKRYYDMKKAIRKIQ